MKRSNITAGGPKYVTNAENEKINTRTMKILNLSNISTLIRALWTMIKMASYALNYMGTMAHSIEFTEEE